MNIHLAYTVNWKSSFDQFWRLP